jgi:hypothetical protein
MTGENPNLLKGLLIIYFTFEKHHSELQSLCNQDNMENKYEWKA